jgi:hypothetical protein
VIVGGSGLTPEQRARLRHAPLDGRDRKLHDFRQKLTELAFATQLEDRKLMQFLSDELVRTYSEALDG